MVAARFMNAVCLKDAHRIQFSLSWTTSFYRLHSSISLSDNNVFTRFNSSLSVKSSSNICSVLFSSRSLRKDDKIPTKTIIRWLSITSQSYRIENRIESLDILRKNPNFDELVFLLLFPRRNFVFVRSFFSRRKNLQTLFLFIFDKMLKTLREQKENKMDQSHFSFVNRRSSQISEHKIKNDDNRREKDDHCQNHPMNLSCS